MCGIGARIKIPSIFVSLQSNSIIKKTSQIGPFRDLNPEMSVISDLSQILNSITNEQSKVHRYGYHHHSASPFFWHVFLHKPCTKYKSWQCIFQGVSHIFSIITVAPEASFDFCSIKATKKSS